MRFLSYYHLSENPFGKYAANKNVYESEDMREALARIEYAVEIDGIALITGEPGTGKTTVIRKYFDGVDRDLHKVMYLSAGNYKVFDFYHALCDSLELPTQACQKVGMYKRIQAEFVRMQEQERVKPIVIIDDAHLLSQKIIDEFKIFYDFEFASRCYVSLVLIGNAGIREQIRKVKYESLKDRIVANYEMQGMTPEETEEYIKSRLKSVGGNEELFNKQVLHTISLTGRGNSRRINSLVTNLLMLGYGERKTSFDVEDVRRARDEMKI